MLAGPAGRGLPRSLTGPPRKRSPAASKHRPARPPHRAQTRGPIGSLGQECWRLSISSPVTSGGVDARRAGAGSGASGLGEAQAGLPEGGEDPECLRSTGPDLFGHLEQAAAETSPLQCSPPCVSPGGAPPGRTPRARARGGNRGPGLTLTGQASDNRKAVATAGWPRRPPRPARSAARAARL